MPPVVAGAGEAVEEEESCCLRRSGDANIAVRCSVGETEDFSQVREGGGGHCSFVMRKCEGAVTVREEPDMQAALLSNLPDYVSRSRLEPSRSECHRGGGGGGREVPSLFHLLGAQSDWTRSSMRLQCSL